MRREGIAESFTGSVYVFDTGRRRVVRMGCSTRLWRQSPTLEECVTAFANLRFHLPTNGHGRAEARSPRHTSLWSRRLRTSFFMKRPLGQLALPTTTVPSYRSQRVTSNPGLAYSGKSVLRLNISRSTPRIMIRQYRLSLTDSVFCKWYVSCMKVTTRVPVQYPRMRSPLPFDLVSPPLIHSASTLPLLSLTLLFIILGCYAMR